MVRRGPPSWEKEAEETVLEILSAEKGGLNFNALLRKARDKKAFRSPNLLSRTLKSLQAKGEIEVEEVPGPGIPRKIYRLSRYREMFDELKRQAAKEPVPQNALFMVIKEIEPDAWWEFVKAADKELDLKRFRGDQSEEEYMRNLKSYCAQTKRAVTTVWSSLVSDYVWHAGFMITTALLMRAYYPSPLDQEDEEKLSKALKEWVESLNKVFLTELEDVVTTNIVNLESLVALNEALEDGKLTEEAVVGKTGEEINRELVRLGYLTVEEGGASKGP